jgi:hypothetical protein
VILPPLVFPAHDPKFKDANLTPKGGVKSGNVWSEPVSRPFSESAAQVKEVNGAEAAAIDEDLFNDEDLVTVI